MTQNLDYTDGVDRKEAGFAVLVLAFLAVLVFAMYKAVVAGDFPPNVTDFLSMLACIIGLCEAAPKVVDRFKGGGKRCH